MLPATCDSHVQQLMWHLRWRRLLWGVDPQPSGPLLCQPGWRRRLRAMAQPVLAAQRRQPQRLPLQQQAGRFNRSTTV